MTPMLSTVMKTSRAAIVALTLGAAAITAMPAQAQSEPQFSFQLGINGGGDAQTFSKGNRHTRPHFDRCLTNRQVERGLRDYGFRNVDVIRNLGRDRVLVVASWRNKDYAMKVDKCSGRVYDVKRLKKFRGQPGFSLQFNF
ncbi:hypothetical protein [Devosia sp. A16]|uniref:hypothetical protein n=1 Tax=Devosia sp. A16 TaxID=1736675 RepID=UPI0006D767A2|nr:hypothetical protein [Devosia sp. A16]